jgi:DNA-binding NarL/FixJ family response regulator
MKTVLLCGGLGTRIRDYKENVPKPMIPVGDKPILWHLMHYYSQYGHRDFVRRLQGKQPACGELQRPRQGANDTQRSSPASAFAPGASRLDSLLHQLLHRRSGAGGFLCQDIPGSQLIKSLELIVLGQTVTHQQFHQIAAMTQRAASSQDLGQADAGIAVAAGYQVHEPQALRPADPRPPYLVQSAPGVSQPRPATEPAGDPGIALSRREMAILRTLTEGASNKIIARKLVITESTVKVHMKAILRKLRLQNPTQARDLGANGPHARAAASCGKLTKMRLRLAADGATPNARWNTPSSAIS